MGGTTKVCHRCGVEKPSEAFSTCSRNPDRLNNLCRECDSARQREWRRAHPLKQSEYNRRYYERHREQCAASARSRYMANIEANRKRRAEYQRRYREAIKAMRRANYQRMKEEGMQNGTH